MEYTVMGYRIEQRSCCILGHRATGRTSLENITRILNFNTLQTHRTPLHIFAIYLYIVITANSKSIKIRAFCAKHAIGRLTHGLMAMFHWCGIGWNTPMAYICNGGHKPTIMNTTVFYNICIQVTHQPTCGLMISRWIRLHLHNSDYLSELRLIIPDCFPLLLRHRARPFYEGKNV